MFARDCRDFLGVAASTRNDLGTSACVPHIPERKCRLTSRRKFYISSSVAHDKRDHILGPLALSSRTRGHGLEQVDWRATLHIHAYISR